MRCDLSGESGCHPSFKNLKTVRYYVTHNFGSITFLVIKWIYFWKLHITIINFMKKNKRIYQQLLYSLKNF